MANKFPQMFDLSGKVAIVTGAANGLGVVFCEAMAEAGADVVCADVDRAGLAVTVEKVKKLGRKAIAIICDVSKEEDARDLIKKAVEEFGHLDILFNNAGIAEKNPVPMHELSTEEWNRILSVDLQGVFYIAREVLKVMVKQKSGKIINIASHWGLRGSSLIPVAAYAAAKGGVVNLTREMAMEYATLGITVNCICPGFHRTNLGGRVDDTDFSQKIHNLVPMQRIAEPDELKGAAIFLASSASSYITGHILVADGGTVAKG